MQRQYLRTGTLGEYVPFFQCACGRRLRQDRDLLHGPFGSGHVQDFQRTVRFGRHDVHSDVRQDFQGFVVQRFHRGGLHSVVHQLVSKRDNMHAMRNTREMERENVLHANHRWRRTYTVTVNSIR